MADEDEPEYGLVMPFVAVASKGGPFDDDAYCAGYEMGKLDEQLEHAAEALAGSHIATTIRTENAEQADLIGMRHGFSCQIETTGVEGWANALFVPPHEKRWTTDGPEAL